MPGIACTKGPQLDPPHLNRVWREEHLYVTSPPPPTHTFCCHFCVCVCGARIEPRTLCMLSVFCISELHPQSLIPIFNQIQKPLGDGRVMGSLGTGCRRALRFFLGVSFLDKILKAAFKSSAILYCQYFHFKKQLHLQKASHWVFNTPLEQSKSYLKSCVVSCQQLFTTLQWARCIYNLAILTKLFVVVLSKRAREVFGNTFAGLLSPPPVTTPPSPSPGCTLFSSHLHLEYPLNFQRVEEATTSTGVETTQLVFMDFHVKFWGSQTHTPTPRSGLTSQTRLGRLARLRPWELVLRTGTASRGRGRWPGVRAHGL